jgi:hypothetical protein
MSFGEDGARRLDDERERDEDIDVDEDSEPEWRVAVVDVSAFMWAPQAARNLVQKGFEVVVPANGESSQIKLHVKRLTSRYCNIRSVEEGGFTISSGGKESCSIY